MITDMNDEEFRRWVIEKNDDYLRARGIEGATVEEAREHMGEAVARAIASGEITPPQQSKKAVGRGFYDKYVLRERSSRRLSLKKCLDEILDDLRGESILGTDHPRFDMAFPVGDGTDKTLGYWTAEDYAESIHSRNRNAVEVAGAARDYSRSAEGMQAALADAGVQFTRDLGRDVNSSAA